MSQTQRITGFHLHSSGKVFVFSSLARETVLMPLFSYISCGSFFINQFLLKFIIVIIFFSLILSFIVSFILLFILLYGYSGNSLSVFSEI